MPKYGEGFPLSGPPVCVSFKNPGSQRCLRSVHDEKMGANFIHLSQVVEAATPPAEIFELEPSLEHDGLVHVRCCENSKYWVAQQLGADSEWFICSTADEPEEDLDNPSCTLFHFRSDPDDIGFTRFHHPLQKKYASVYSGADRTYLKLRDEPPEDDPTYDYISDVFMVTRWPQLVKVLPKYVAFKGANGKYLTLKEPYLTQKEPCLQFSSSEITDPAVVHETSTDDEGVVRIRSICSGRFWRLRDHWICADSVHEDEGTAFKALMKTDNYIALQSISNGRFCKSLSYQGAEWLSASAGDSSGASAMLLFEEAVRSRRIYDLEYHVGGKKTDTPTRVSRQEVSATNRTQESHHVDQTVEMYERKERTWNVDLKANLSIKTHFTASIPIKIIELEGGVESHLEVEAKYNWGDSNIEERSHKQEISYPVPPMTKVICSVLTREVVVDVPFSYKQEDVLYNGETVPPRQMHDGIYRCMKMADIHVHSKDEEIK